MDHKEKTERDPRIHGMHISCPFSTRGRRDKQFVWPYQGFPRRWQKKMTWVWSQGVEFWGTFFKGSKDVERKNPNKGHLKPCQIKTDRYKGRSPEPCFKNQKGGEAAGCGWDFPSVVNLHLFKIGFACGSRVSSRFMWVQK